MGSVEKQNTTCVSLAIQCFGNRSYRWFTNRSSAIDLAESFEFSNGEPSQTCANTHETKCLSIARSPVIFRLIRLNLENDSLFWLTSALGSFTSGTPLASGAARTTLLSNPKQHNLQVKKRTFLFDSELKQKQPSHARWRNKTVHVFQNNVRANFGELGKVLYRLCATFQTKVKLEIVCSRPLPSCRKSARTSQSVSKVPVFLQFSRHSR